MTTSRTPTSPAADPFARAAESGPVAAEGPRQFVADGALTGAGLPEHRLERVVERRAFVSLKRAFLEALEPATGREAVWLREQVRLAEMPLDLWLLRSSAFEALAGPAGKERRRSLRRALDTLFPDSQPDSAFSPF
ncbi:MAG: hypothetical protein ACK5UM_14800 [Pseudomonadota bacterium]|jgi:hypothetical protein|nr:hypothetical protein [Rubrivivax sp.]MCA3258904.1 hypothetical protein [Rubrivivax sp.]MCE2910634.1 hypothetical protein [Rubrivivax sp.]MCZ8032500.1 hypothetical protein [Rubrivivax sp.]